MAIGFSKNGSLERHGNRVADVSVDSRGQIANVSAGRARHGTIDYFGALAASN